MLVSSGRVYKDQVRMLHLVQIVRAVGTDYRHVLQSKGLDIL